MTAVTPATGEPIARIGAQFRYGAVFLAVLALVLAEIIAPDTNTARGLEFALAGLALTITVATSRAKGAVKRRNGILVATVAAGVAIASAAGWVSAEVTFGVATVLIAGIPVTLAGGLLRLIREEGVTFQVVAGALAIYLTVGLMFASVIAFVAHTQSTPFFKGNEGVSLGTITYYSFTVLTTTGFGDYTAATRVGHALAVLEMLTGQLYLVTVIGMVVGNFAGRRSRSG